MTSDDYKAILDALCKDCGGLLGLPGVPVPAELLRWCICALQCVAELAEREPIGFNVKAKKSKKAKGEQCRKQ